MTLAESNEPAAPNPASGRIARAFARSESADSRTLIAYLTAGDPTPDRSLSLIQALERGGTDILELGVPFSDPIADGPVIQRASERALRSGTCVPGVLRIVRSLRKTSELPVVIFSYLNPILRYGFRRFAADAADAGVDGALLTDLAIEEAETYVSEMRARRLDCVFLVTQTTPQARIARIGRQSSGFVYVVSRVGVTGDRASLAGSALPLLERTRRATRLPLALGFGLSTRKQMQEVAPHTDGAVVGSAFMRLIEAWSASADLESRLEGMAAEFKGGLAVPADSGTVSRV